jgi:hypothetical protein
MTHQIHRTTALYHFSQELYDTIKIVRLQGWSNQTKVRVAYIFWLQPVDDEWDRM